MESERFMAGGVIPPPKERPDTIRILASLGSVECECGWTHDGTDDETNRAFAQHVQESHRKSLHVVIADGGKLFGGYFDSALAHEAAKAIEGAVASLLILADYRKKAENG
jgi:Zn ribbon nucleic-acid-binding protein